MCCNESMFDVKLPNGTVMGFNYNRQVSVGPVKYEEAMIENVKAMFSGYKTGIWKSNGVVCALVDDRVHALHAIPINYDPRPDKENYTIKIEE